MPTQVSSGDLMDRVEAKYEAFWDAHPELESSVEHLFERVDSFNIRHPEVVGSLVIATLGGVTVAAEALEMQRAAQPNTVGNSVVRATSRAVAVGAGYLTAKSVKALIHHSKTK